MSRRRGDKIQASKKLIRSNVGWPPKYFPFDTNKNSSALILPHSLAPLMNEQLSTHPPSCLSRAISSSICHSPNSICHLGLARLTRSAALLSPRHSRNHFMLFTSCRLGPSLSFLSICLLRFRPAFLAAPGSGARTRRTSTHVLAAPSRTDLQHLSCNPFSVWDPFSTILATADGGKESGGGGELRRREEQMKRRRPQIWMGLG